MWYTRKTSRKSYQGNFTEVNEGFTAGFNTGAISLGSLPSPDFFFLIIIFFPFFNVKHFANFIDQYLHTRALATDGGNVDL